MSRGEEGMDDKRDELIVAATTIISLAIIVSWGEMG